MPARPPQPNAEHYTYVPTDVQKVMSQHLQQASLPAHLQQYVGASRPTYISPRVQQELTTAMQKNMPAHLQQYAGAYVQQNIVDSPGGLTPQPTQLRPHAPVPNRRNLSHSGAVSAEQAEATQYLSLFQSDPKRGGSPQSNAASPGETQPSAQPSDPHQPLPPEAPAPPPGGNYDFIMSPAKPPRSSLFGSGGNSMQSRLLVVGGGILLLIVMFVVLKGVLSKPNTAVPAMVSLAQDQQELVHLSQNAIQNAVSTDIKNFAQTANLSLTSEQQQIVTYLKNNGRKVSSKELALKVSKATDTELQTAVSASNFDATFTSIMQTQLQTYQVHLKQAYTQVTGPKGRALISSDYDAAQLLAKQLQS